MNAQGTLLGEEKVVDGGNQSVDIVGLLAPLYIDLALANLLTMAFVGLSTW